MFTTKHSQAWARALPSNTPGASSSSGSSWMLSTTQVRAPCRSAKARFHTSSSASRARKLNRARARLSFRRGVSHSSLGRGLGGLATAGLQFRGGGRQALAEGAAQGDLVFVELALAVRAGMVAGAVGCAAAAGVE